MKKTLYLLILVILLVSCNSEKKYKYIETVQETGILGSTDVTDNEPEIIKATNDSSAYVEAYSKFCISQKVAQDMTKALGSSAGIPLSFKLLNEQGENIANSVYFINKDSIEREIKKRIFSQPNNIASTVEESKKERHQAALAALKVDSEMVKKLKPYFRVKTDKFDPDQTKWYIPLSAPRYINRNGIYCYFGVKDKVPQNFRFQIQYYADDWLFIEKYQFSIDGEAFEFYPNKVERDNGDGGHIWEWCDDKIMASDLDLIKALANAKSAKIKFVGQQYYKIKTITGNQIRNIKRSLDLYKAMGGKF